MHQCDHACQRTVFACFEDGQNGCDGDKDAEEEFADFGYRVPVEFVARPNLFGVIISETAVIDSSSRSRMRFCSS